MDELSSQQELPAQLERKGAQAGREVRWLDDHGTVAVLGVARRGDAVRDPERICRVWPANTPSYCT
jgi:hypothetical protein